MNFWGITGTNGKTTVTWAFSEFMNATPQRKCGYILTVEVFDGVRHFYTGYTTPPLPQLLEIVAAMESNGCTDCVMEVSSHAIHQNRTGKTVFAGGAFTNLSEDHLSYHKTMEEYFRVKLSFAEKLAASHEISARSEGSVLAPYVVCLDGENGREMYDAVKRFPLNVLPVSISTSDLDLSALPLRGDYNRSNVLVAARLAEAAGVPLKTIQATIPTLMPRWGRLERIDNPNVRATVYVDFAHTPDGLEKMLKALREELAEGVARRTSASGRKPQLWLVFGAGGDRHPHKRLMMGATAARWADRLVVTSDNPGPEDPAAIIAQVVQGMPASADPILEPDRRAAIGIALARAEAGDIVVIAGKGHEKTQEIAGVKYPFDDREVVRFFVPAH